MNDCTKRKLDNTYLVVYAIRNEINIKKGDYIEKEDIYTFVGIDKRGFRTLINVYPDRKNNNRDLVTVLLLLFVCNKLQKILDFF